MSVSDRPSNSGGKPQSRGWLRRGLIALGILIVLLVAVVGGGTLWVMSGGADVWLASLLASKLGSPDRPAVVEGMTGGVPFHPRLAKLVLSDSEGGYLTLRNLAIDIDGTALWHGTLRITQLHADEIDLERLPPAQTPQPVAPSQAPPQIPRLPVALQLERLTVDRIVIGPTLAGSTFGGKPAELSLAAHASLSDARVDLHIVGGRINGTAADLTVDAKGQSDASGLHIAARADGHLSAVLPEKLRNLLGENPKLQLGVLLPSQGPIGFQNVALDLGALTLWAGGHYRESDGRLDFNLAGSGDLQPLSSVVGQSVAGKLRLGGHIGGSVATPEADLKVNGDQLVFQQDTLRSLDLDLRLRSPSANQLALDTMGSLAVFTQAGNALPAGLGDRIDLAISARTDRQFKAIDLSSATVKGAGLDVSATGKMTPEQLEAKAHLVVADLARFGGLANLPLAGNGTIDLDARRKVDGAIDAQLSGNLRQFQTGIPAVDALTGGTVDLALNGSRGGDGAVDLSKLDLRGAAVDLQARGALDQAKDQISLHATGGISNLAVLEPVLHQPYSGRLDFIADIGGSLKAPSIKADLKTTDAVLAGRAIDRLDVQADVPSVSNRAGTVSANLVAEKIAAAFRAKVAQPQQGQVQISDLILTGPATRATGDLTVDLAAKRAAGGLNLAITDLGGWSPLIGPAKGTLNFATRLISASRQRMTVDLRVGNLAMGSGTAAKSISNLALNADLSGPDLAQATRFTGTAKLQSQGIKAGEASLDSVELDAKSHVPGRFDIALATEGRVAAQGSVQKLALNAHAALAMLPKGQTVHVADLALDYGPLVLRTRHSLDLAHAGDDLHLHGLALAVGQGTLDGNVDLDENGVKATLTGRDLPLATLSQLGGQRGVQGKLGLRVSLSGPRAAYGGHIAATIVNLKNAALVGQDVPPVNVDLNATISPRSVGMAGTISASSQRKLTVTGSVPIMEAALPAPPALDNNGPLSIRMNGAGRFEQWAAFLPLGEDRLAGGFAIDATVQGSVAHPVAGGHVIVDNGSYENAASGMRLSHLDLDAAGNQQSFEIRRLSARDTGTGSFQGSGRVALGAPSTIDLAFQMQHFTVARRDEATVVASGNAKITGPLKAPNLVSRIVIENAEINIPERLPATVVTLDVTRVNSALPAEKHGATEPPATPFGIGLDVKISAPGPVFVRGMGIDSEWKGNFAVTGSSAAPNVVGQLEATRGTYSILGKDFTIAKGIIGFYGGAQIDPGINIVADTTTADITAEIKIGGTASSPTLALSSTPALPQDEVLSRIMFGKRIGQISPGEGLALAQAAGSLAGIGGHGPGMLDKLRKITGLDRLSIGSAGSSDVNGTNSSQNSSSQGGSTLGSTTLSGGKYVAPGVFVGASQGATPGSTSAKVEIEITPHVSVDATAGATAASQSLGVHYGIDY